MKLLFRKSFFQTTLDWLTKRIFFAPKNFQENHYGLGKGSVVFQKHLQWYLKLTSVGQFKFLPKNRRFFSHFRQSVTVSVQQAYYFFSVCLDEKNFLRNLRNCCKISFLSSTAKMTHFHDDVLRWFCCQEETFNLFGFSAKNKNWDQAIRLAFSFLFQPQQKSYFWCFTTVSSLNRQWSRKTKFFSMLLFGKHFLCQSLSSKMCIFHIYWLYKIFLVEQEQNEWSIFLLVAIFFWLYNFLSFMHE